MKIRNLTPHDITIYTNDYNEMPYIIPATGIVARVSTTQEIVGSINGIPVQKIKYGNVENLPEPQEDVVFIVSQMVLSALNGSRTDVFAPDTGKGAVRDKEGKILGTLNLVVL